MPKARNGAVTLAYETFGDDRPEAVILVNGLGSQMTHDIFVDAICAAAARARPLPAEVAAGSAWEAV